MSKRITYIGSKGYHNYRSDLQNSRHKFETEKRGRVAFLGGSITYNSGWRDSIMDYLENRFPETDFEFINAGIPSMGSTPAAFRLDRDILSKGSVDLLFEEAAVNDETNGRSPSEQLRAMEGIIRHVRRTNPRCDMVLMHFVDPGKMEVYRKDSIPRVIQHHEQVAEHYQIPSINLALEVTDRIDHGEFSWEDDFVDLHPSPFGQGIYAQSIIAFLENSFKEVTPNQHDLERHEIPVPIDEFNYAYGKLVDVRESIYDTGWRYESQWAPHDGKGTRANYTDVPMLISTDSSAPLHFEFHGNAVGIAVAAGPDAGIIRYRIDDSEWIKLNLKTRWSDQLHLPWYYTLASALSNDAHTLTIELVKANSSSEMGVCRIRYFYVNGN